MIYTKFTNPDFNFWKLDKKKTAQTDILVGGTIDDNDEMFDLQFKKNKNKNKVEKKNQNNIRFIL